MAKRYAAMATTGPSASTSADIDRGDLRSYYND
jgi:hypothetical protein